MDEANLPPAEDTAWGTTGQDSANEQEGPTGRSTGHDIGERENLIDQGTEEHQGTEGYARDTSGGHAGDTNRGYTGETDRGHEIDEGEENEGGEESDNGEGEEVNGGEKESGGRFRRKRGGEKRVRTRKKRILKWSPIDGVTLTAILLSFLYLYYVNRDDRFMVGLIFALIFVVGGTTAFVWHQTAKRFTPRFIDHAKVNMANDARSYCLIRSPQSQPSTTIDHLQMALEWCLFPTLMVFFVLSYFVGSNFITPDGERIMMEENGDPRWATYFLLFIIPPLFTAIVPPMRIIGDSSLMTYDVQRRILEPYGIRFRRMFRAIGGVGALAAFGKVAVAKGGIGGAIEDTFTVLLYTLPTIFVATLIYGYWHTRFVNDANESIHEFPLKWYNFMQSKDDHYELKLELLKRSDESGGDENGEVTVPPTPPDRSGTHDPAFPAGSQAEMPGPFGIPGHPAPQPPGQGAPGQHPGAADEAFAPAVGFAPPAGDVLPPSGPVNETTAPGQNSQDSARADEEKGYTKPSRERERTDVPPRDQGSLPASTEFAAIDLAPAAAFAKVTGGPGTRETEEGRTEQNEKEEERQEEKDVRQEENGGQDDEEEEDVGFLAKYLAEHPDQSNSDADVKREHVKSREKKPVAEHDRQEKYQEKEQSEELFDRETEEENEPVEKETNEETEPAQREMKYEQEPVRKEIENDLQDETEPVHREIKYEQEPVRKEIEDETEPVEREMKYENEPVETIEKDETKSPTGKKEDWLERIKRQHREKMQDANDPEDDAREDAENDPGELAEKQADEVQDDPLDTETDGIDDPETGSNENEDRENAPDDDEPFRF